MLGCGDGSVSPLDDGYGSEQGTAAISLRWSKALGITLARIEVVVTAPDMRKLRQNIILYGNPETVVVEVPAGRDRVFTLSGYDPTDQ